MGLRSTALQTAPSSARRVKIDASSLLALFRAHAAHAESPADDLPLMRDIAAAVLSLGARGVMKAIVRAYATPLEMAIVRHGEMTSISVYDCHAQPEIILHEVPIPLRDLAAATDAHATRAANAPGADEALGAETRALAGQLRAMLALSDGAAVGEPIVRKLMARGGVEGSIAFFASFEMLVRAGLPKDGVERADLHALLGRGEISVERRARRALVGHGHPFLFASALLDVTSRALARRELGESTHVRQIAGQFAITLRSDREGRVALTVGSTASQKEGVQTTWPALRIEDVAESAVSLARAMGRAFLRADRTQTQNLRLSDFRRRTRDLAEQLKACCIDDAKINASPEPYRAFVRGKSSGSDPQADTTTAATRLRYTERWRALVPGIDLRSTFLCGAHLIVGAQNELFCLDRTTGSVRWRSPTRRAISIVSAGGVARLHADGLVTVHDLATGNVRMETHIEPRRGGPPVGGAVAAPGLPRLLIVTEGERHVVAIDMNSGESRWRFAWGRGGQLRLKRWGRLLYATGADSALTAYDVRTGELVWRTRHRFRFSALPTIDHDAVYAIAGGSRAAAELVAFDAFSGTPRFGVDLTPESGRCTIEGSPIVADGAVIVVRRERFRLSLVAFDRHTGEKLWEQDEAPLPVGTAWIAVDDLIIGNTPTGELVAFAAQTGLLRYRRVLGRVVELDMPRRLEPVLRSGGLYVPHADVHVFRPRDGERLATIGPCDAIPDLLRVDEACNVYVAEESGHLASFAVGPRLSLVKG